ncbi:MAG: ribokinase [Chloroflexi bacterium]|nr:ribokinase [Chloroflexota bacterium]
MLKMPGAEPIDYLVLGHITQDLTPQGPKLGGTASYAALTAKALGMRVGIITSHHEDLPIGQLSSIPIVNSPAQQTTTFENSYSQSRRVQTISRLADPLDYYLIPETWRQAPIIHLGPVAQEFASSMVRQFPNSMIFVTPQGWMREWDSSGKVSPSEWPEADFVLRHVDAAVISGKDVLDDQNRINEMAAAVQILITTHGADGVTLYTNGQMHHIEAPKVTEVDSTGAGDIFAAAFFVTLKGTNDPLEAARFANLAAALSVTRRGLSSIPTKDEIYDMTLEVH